METLLASPGLRSHGALTADRPYAKLRIQELAAVQAFRCEPSERQAIQARAARTPSLLECGATRRHERIDMPNIGNVLKEEIVRHSDVVSFHIPLTAETKGLVDDEYLFHFKKPIFLLNTARGQVVQTKAVLNGIKQGKILGAGLDVLEVEKFPALSEQEWFEELRVASPAIAHSLHAHALPVPAACSRGTRARR